MSARSRLRHVLVFLFLLGAALDAAAKQSIVFVVRHAERADGGRPSGMSQGPADPDLSPAGKARAERLAAMLKDAEISRIFVTEFKRTQQTAAPLAASSDVEPSIVPAKNVAALVRQLKSSGRPALVVAHSNTVPDILKALGVRKNIEIADDEYDKLFIVVLGSSEPVLVTLKF